MKKLLYIIVLLGEIFSSVVHGHLQQENTDDSLSKINLLVTQLPYKQVEDVDLIARTIYGEARGEKSTRSLEAIAHVILNRVKDTTGKWSGTVQEVVLQKKQFSCWDRSDINYESVITVSLKDPHFRKCYVAAMNALKGQDFTRGATHYHTTYVSPKWAVQKGMIRVAQIQNHIFYRA